MCRKQIGGAIRRRPARHRVVLAIHYSEDMNAPLCCPSASTAAMQACILDELRLRVFPGGARSSALLKGVDAAVQQTRRKQVGGSSAHLPQPVWVEFGAASGKSALFITERSGHHVHSFDSFRGLPEAWRPAPIVPNASRVSAEKREALEGKYLASGQIAHMGYVADAIIWDISVRNRALQ